MHVQQRWIDIPSVYGMTVRKALERLAEAGFAPVASPRRFTADAGDVVGGTLPPEGTALLRTARIDLLPVPKGAVEPLADEALTVDELIDAGIMPDLAGFGINEALALLQAHGFHTWPRGAFTDKVEPDFVVFTEPRRGMLMNFEPITIWYAIPVPPPDPIGPPPDLKVLKP
ncbi:MAG TPA: PASTA domain-containing protein [Jatrophihabitans sp.]|nr:PASTA domain-containing protein [Jatrophihabitans sp.]